MKSGLKSIAGLARLLKPGVVIQVEKEEQYKIMCKASEKHNPSLNYLQLRNKHGKGKR